MAYRRVRQPEPARQAEKEPVLSREAYRHIETLIYSLPATSLERVLLQRAWDVEGITEGTQAEHEEDSLDDPGYEGQGADEDSDFTEPEEEPSSPFDIPSPDDETTVTRPLVDMCLEIINGKVSFWSPLGSLWMKISMQDPVGGLYKLALQRRIRDLALIMRYFLGKNKNEEHFLNARHPSRSPLTQKEVAEHLAHYLKVQPKAVKGLVSRVSRLVHSAYIQLPDGTVCALADFFERELTDPQTAYEMFFTLAAHIQEECKNPLTDKQLAESMHVQRSRVQQVRSAWLPNSRKRRKQYQEGKSLADLLDITDNTKRAEAKSILEKALEMAQRRTDAYAQQAQKQLQQWLEQLKGLGEGSYARGHCGVQ